MDLDPNVVADIKGKNHKKTLNQLWKQYYSLDMMWIKHLCLPLPQEPHCNQNINDMTEYMLHEWKSNCFMQQCIFSMAGIHAGMEGKFSLQLKNIMERAHSCEKFRSARGRHERELEFDYIFHSYYNANGRPFANDDDCMLEVMCGLTAFHEVAALGCHKVQLSDGSNMEFMFCPHCGYFANNPLTMNMHVRKHYKAGLYCGGPECNLITNKPDAMLQHGSLFHSFGKRNKGPPVKLK